MGDGYLVRVSGGISGRKKQQAIFYHANEICGTAAAIKSCAEVMQGFVPDNALEAGDRDTDEPIAISFAEDQEAIF